MHSVPIVGDTKQNLCNMRFLGGLAMTMMKETSVKKIPTHKAVPIVNEQWDTEQQSEQQKTQTKITAVLAQNVQWVQSYFERCGDLVVRRFLIGQQQECEAVLLYLDGMINTGLVQTNILQPLLYPIWIDAAVSVNVSQQAEKSCCENTAKDKQQTYPSSLRSTDEEQQQFFDYFAFVQSQLLPAGEVTFAQTMEEGVLAMMNGDAFLLLSDSTVGFVINAKGFPHRNMGEPRNEKVLRGPQEAFVEAMRINTAMLRRRLHTSQLKLEQIVLGQQTQTAVTIAYMDGIANETIIAEVCRRLNKIKDVDSILNASCVEQYLEERPYSIFPQMQYTERPDKAAAALLEGRIALIVDGSPDVILLPVLFMQLLQSPEDCYTRIIPGTFIRWIRYVGLLIATTLPSLYVAITSFHPELLPIGLLLSITTAREGVPFPAFVEALMMEFAFELLREASIRLPGAIGNTIGIVGALVIGDAAVSARLVAPQMVIVVAITAIGSFAIPSIEASDAIRLIRFPLMLLAAVFGLYGVMLGWLLVLMHMVRLRSFGLPYLQPLAPLHRQGLMEAAVRVPRWRMLQPIMEKRR